MVLLRALVTGITGFAGSHLAEYLLGQDAVEVYGVVRGERFSHIDHLRARLTLLQGDVTDFEVIKSVIGEIQPELVFHLAGQAAVARSFSDPGQTFVSNALGQLNVLEAVAQTGVAARVLVVGSGDEYGVVPRSELPIKETNPLRPNSPYAVSKIAQDLLGYQFYISHKVHSVRVRPFNHIGPRQSDAFVVSSFAKQVAEAELDLRAPAIKVGNLEARRDFTDVRDIVRGYWLALRHGEPGEVYNLGSGRSYSISDILRLLLAQSHISLTVEQDPARLRPADVEEIVCDSSKFRARTGWKPIFPLEETLAETLDYWRYTLSQREIKDEAAGRGE